MTFIPDVSRCPTAQRGQHNDPNEQEFLVLNRGVRRLTPLECERLQGFPDGWTEGHADSSRYRPLGNAVAVPVVEWIGRRLFAITSENMEVVA